MGDTGITRVDGRMFKDVVAEVAGCADLSAEERKVYGLNGATVRYTLAIYHTLAEVALAAQILEFDGVEYVISELDLYNDVAVMVAPDGQKVSILEGDVIDRLFITDNALDVEEYLKAGDLLC